jgi:NADP-dependent 3-hydroxy acid dehydrogenase YdfG
VSNNIEGKVVVITGASSGLGEASARLLPAQGASNGIVKQAQSLGSSALLRKLTPVTLPPG